MTTRLYVFVDESGNHTTEGIYVVAGCWCISEFDDPNRILRPTKNKISDNVVYDGSGASPGRELKGSAIGHPKLNSVLTYLRNISPNDSTIRTNSDPWDTGFPIGFTIVETDAETSAGFTNDYLGQGRTRFSVQILSLLSVLAPLLYIPDWYPSTIDEYYVLLDAETWQTPSSMVSTIFSNLARAPDIEFGIYDSQAAPGIQLADIAAHSRRRRLQHGDCAVASAVLDELRL